MNNKFRIFLVSVLLSLITVTSIFVFNSCQKDMGVDPVAADRVITGEVKDKISGNVISDARVVIIPSIDPQELITFTDNKGVFKVNSPVLPSKTPYFIKVTAPGYYPAETTAECDCEVLTVELLQLQKITCGIDYSPSKVSFDSVVIGLSKTLQVTISNPTTDTTVILSLKLSNKVFSIEGQIPNTPFSLAPGESFTLLIKFTPDAAKKYSEILMVETNCPISNIFDIPLEGIGINADCGLEVNPSLIQFGATTIGTVQSKTVAIRNPFNNPIRIDSIAWNNKDIISVSHNLNNTILNANDSRTITVTLNAKYGIPILLDSLKIYTNCDKSKRVIVPITASIFAKTCNVIVLYPEQSQTSIYYRLFFPNDLMFRIANGPNYNLVITSISLIPKSDSNPNENGPLDSIVRLNPEVPPTVILSKGEYRDFHLEYIKPIIGTVRFDIVIRTDGSCDSTVIPVELYQEQEEGSADGLKPWSALPNNPDPFKGMYWDLYDPVNKLATGNTGKFIDSNKVCPTDVYIPGSGTVVSKNTHMRFDGTVKVNNIDYAIIKGKYSYIDINNPQYNSIKYLGNNSNLEWKVNKIKERLLAVAGTNWTDGCNNTNQFLQGDIFAVRTGNSRWGFEQIIYVRIWAITPETANSEAKLGIEYMVDYVKIGTFK